jgi:phage shock protein C
MSTRTRTTHRPEEEDESLGYGPLGFEDDVTDEDIEDFLARQDEREQKPGFLNLPTIAGLATIGVGAAYLLEQFGLFASGFDVSSILGPWLIGVLIILVGFGVLSWKPKRSSDRGARRRAAERRRARQQQAPRPVGRTTERPREPRTESTTTRSHTARKQFTRSQTNRKIAGVAGGIGEYFGIDPTIIRIAFVIALISSGGMAIAIYLLMAFIMPKPDVIRSSRPPDTLDDERVIVIRS